MSSSTSSSELASPPAPAAGSKTAGSTAAAPPQRAAPPRSREALVVLSVLALLAAGELLARVAGDRASDELRALGSLPERAERLAAGSGPRVLLLGNSLTVSGVLPDTLAARLRLAAGASCEVVALLGAEMGEWTRILEHRFLAPGLRPDLVVVASGPRVWDVHDIRGKRLALAVPAAAMGRIAREEFADFEPRAVYLHASLFRSFAAGPILRDALLSRLLPHHAEGSGWIEDQLQAQRAAAAAAATPPRRTYRRLLRLGSLGREHEVPVLLALLPTHGGYELPAETQAAAAEAGVRLLDLRRVPELRREHYTDGVHLNREGAAAFTPLLARAIAERLVAAPDGDGLRRGS